MGKKGKKANNEKQSKILKEGGSEPKPIGDHRENETVATKAIVGGETNFETTSAKPESISALELVSLL